MSALFTALTYRKGDGVVDGNPVRSLMLALRRGDPVAFDENGNALSPEFWAHRGFDRAKMASCRVPTERYAPLMAGR